MVMRMDERPATAAGRDEADAPRRKRRRPAARAQAAAARVEGLGSFYLLQHGIDEREKTVLEQATSRLEYGRPGEPREAPELSDKALRVGREVFLPYARGHSLPGRPDQSGRRGFYVEGSGFVALRGVGGKDMAKVWHMLLIPRASEARRDGVLRWVFDLRPQHLGLLERMRAAALRFVELNRAYFERCGPAEIAGKPLAHWLDPANIQFGFHSVPSIGYLHMHQLVGPLTEFGAQDMYRQRWVSLEEVLAVLRAGRPATELQRRLLDAAAKQPRGAPSATGAHPAGAGAGEEECASGGAAAVGTTEPPLNARPSEGDDAKRRRVTEGPVASRLRPRPP